MNQFAFGSCGVATGYYITLLWSLEKRTNEIALI